MDAVYFAATRERVIAELEKAMHSVRYARREFESLKTEQALPPEYRKAYTQMADSLLRTEQAIVDAVDASRALEIKPRAFQAFHHDTPVAPDVATAIRRTIEEINAAEVQLVGHCESVKAAMREQDVSGLIDWAMPIRYDFTVLLDPGPARAFYETCGEGEEPLRISLGLYMPFNFEKDDVPWNWNVLEGREGNPLHADYHGYLVHCIIDHSVIPWQLISHIKEIEVRLEFYTHESTWKRASVSLK